MENKTRSIAGATIQVITISHLRGLQKNMLNPSHKINNADGMRYKKNA